MSPNGASQPILPHSPYSTGQQTSQHYLTALLTLQGRKAWPRTSCKRAQHTTMWWDCAAGHGCMQSSTPTTSSSGRGAASGLETFFLSQPEWLFSLDPSSIVFGCSVFKPGACSSLLRVLGDAFHRENFGSTDFLCRSLFGVSQQPGLRHLAPASGPGAADAQVLLIDHVGTATRVDNQNAKIALLFF